MNAKSKRAPRIISTQAGLQWLMLTGEAQAAYTNFGDGRNGDASELVAMINADPARNLGHSDWRMPTIDELKTLFGTADAQVRGWFWSASAYVGSSSLTWGVYFSSGDVDYDHRNNYGHVRLVRASQ